jgi:hypothetical protein
MDIFDYHAQKAADSTRPLAERMRDIWVSLSGNHMW